MQEKDQEEGEQKEALVSVGYVSVLFALLIDFTQKV